MTFIKKNYFIILISLFYLILYIHNLSIGVYAGDTGDFISAAVLGGVPHAPGYPLFTFLGFLLTRINFLPSPAFSVSLISAVSGVLTIFIFYFLIKKLTNNLIISITSTLVLGSSYFFWFYSEIAEVFILNAFFIVSLLYLAILLKEKWSLERFYLFSFLAGLSLTNHQTVILIFPTLLIILFDKRIFKIKFWKLCFKNVILGILFFILGLLIYIYVPIASHFKPAVNWDNVNSLQSFLHLILRLDYGTFNAGSFNAPNIYERIVILKTYLFYLLTQCTPPVIFISLLGLIYLFFKNLRFAIGFLLGFLISGPIFITYSGFPLLSGFYLGVYERFFIESAVFIFLFFAFGLELILNFLRRILRRELSVKICMLAFLLIPLLLFKYNYPKTNLSRSYIGDNLGRDFLSYLPYHSIVFLSGDTELFNAWYVHYGLNFRPDIRIINLNGTYTDPFFTNELNNYKKANPNKNLLEDVDAVIFNLYKNYPVFSYTPIAIKEYPNIHWIPYGLTFKMTDKKITEAQYIKINSQIWNKINPSISQFPNSLILGSYSLSSVPDVYAQSMISTGNYLYSTYKDKTLAENWYKLSTITDPTYALSYQTLGFFQMVVNKDCTSAEENLDKSLNLNEYDHNTYYFLYENEIVCLNDKNAAYNTAVKFSNIFRTNFNIAFKEELKKMKQ